MSAHQLRLQTEISKVQLFDENRTKQDVQMCLDHFKELRPIAQIFTSNIGQQDMKLSLKGTMPCTIQGTVYHIPVLIWIPRNYPYECPMCFVDPSQGQNMRVTPGLHVMPSGQIVNHSCIDQWSPDSGLFFLLNQLISLFSHNAPVHSVQASPSTHVTQQSYNTQYGQQQPLNHQPQSSQYSGSFSAYNSQGGQNQGQQYDAQYGAATPPQYYNNGNDYQQQSTSGFQPQPSSTIYQPQQSTNQPQQDERLSAEIVRRSAVEAAQNRVVGTLKPKHEASCREIRQAQNVHAKLKERALLLGQMQSQLNGEIAGTQQAVDWYDNSTKRLSTSVAALQQQYENFQLDNAVEGSCVLHDQLIELQAEQDAIEETIYSVKNGFTKNWNSTTSNLSTMREIIQKLAQDKFDVMATRQKALAIARQSPTY